MSSLMRSVAVLNQSIFELERDFIQKKRHFESFLSEYFEISRKATQYLGGSFSLDMNKGFEMIPNSGNMFHDSAINFGVSHLVNIDNSYFKANFYSDHDDALESYLSERNLKIKGPYPRIDNESLELFLLSSFSERVAHEFEITCQDFLEHIIDTDATCLADDIASEKVDLSEEFIFALEMTRKFQKCSLLFNSEVHFSESSNSASYKKNVDFEGVVFEDNVEIDSVREEVSIFFKSRVENLAIDNFGSGLFFLSSAQVFVFYLKALISAIDYTYGILMKLLTGIFNTLNTLVSTGIKGVEEKKNTVSLSTLHQLSDNLELVKLKLIVLGYETKANFD